MAAEAYEGTQAAYTAVSRGRRPHNCNTLALDALQAAGIPYFRMLAPNETYDATAARYKFIGDYGSPDARQKRLNDQRRLLPRNWAEEKKDAFMTDYEKNWRQLWEQWHGRFIVSGPIGDANSGQGLPTWLPTFR